MMDYMWKDIIGHEAQKRELEDCILTGRMPHAFLFAGPAGIGKTTLAREFFGAVNCLEARGEACGSCASCLKTASGSHPDLITVSPFKEQIIIDDVRSAIAESGLKPYEARLRFIVVEPAERLNKASSNALLKTLEEPPEGTVVILVSHRPSLLLPTIVSRCRVVRFTPVDASALPESTADRAVLRLTSGAMGGLTSAEKEYVSKLRPKVFDVIRGGDPVGLVSKYLSDQDQGAAALSALLVLVESILRDLLVLAHGGEDIINEELRDAAFSAVGYQDAEALASCLREIRQGINENINQRAAANELLFRLKAML